LRKAFVILVLTAIFFNEVGYLFYYSYQQYQVKAAVKKELLSVQDNCLDVIELNQNKQSIMWEEEGREFRLNNEMYDVKKTVIKNGKTYLYCLSDKKEEALLKKAGAAAHQNNSKPGNNKNKHILKLQANDYLLTGNLISFYSSQQPLQQFFIFNEQALSNPGDIVVPPPRA